jgi:hypothetical protein
MLNLKTCVSTLLSTNPGARGKFQPPKCFWYKPGYGCARLLECNLARTQLLNDGDDFARVRRNENNLIRGHDIAVLADHGNLIEDIRWY